MELLFMRMWSTILGLCFIAINRKNFKCKLLYINSEKLAKFYCNLWESLLNILYADFRKIILSDGFKFTSNTIAILSKMQWIQGVVSSLQVV